MPNLERIPGPHIRWELLLSATSAAFLPAVFVGFVSMASGSMTALAPAADWVRFSVLTPAGPAEPAPEIFRKLAPLVYASHRLQKGESNIWSVAKSWGTTVPSLQATNGNELVLLSPGMNITIHNKQGLLYAVKKEGETLDSVIGRFRKDPGQARELKQKAVEANGLPGTALLGAYELEQGETVLLPGVTIDFDTYRFPFSNPGWTRISSGFGLRLHPILKYRRMHEGLDLPKPYGTPVYASRSGRVTHAGWMEGYGLMVEVRHSDGYSTRYGHLSKIAVGMGQWVQRGRSLLGKVGNSGLSTGPHLHFEVRDRSGRAINPRRKIGRR